MSGWLSESAIRHAVAHLVRFGDTDIFPPLAEIEFLRVSEDAVAKALAAADLSKYEPKTSVEALAPKSRFGFRISHQLSLTDTLLLLASAIDLGHEIESRRLAQNGIAAFSYRFQLGTDGEIFAPDRTYRNWLDKQTTLIRRSKDLSQVVKTDIADFYHRIYFHRLEGLLEPISGKDKPATLLKRVIKKIRNKQSFGLPVGGAAARLLAEWVLTDVDRALQDEGIVSTRFVDDFRLFLTSKQTPYDVLAFLAESLVGEGLSLNASKTHVVDRLQYEREITTAAADVFDASQSEALEALSAAFYGDEEPDRDELAKLQNLNLVDMFQEAAEEPEWDFGKIRRILRAIRLIDPDAAIDYISDHFHDLLPFAREIVLVLSEVKDREWIAFDHLKDEFISALGSAPARNLPLIRAWLLEAFVRGLLPCKPDDLKKMASFDTPLDRRQLHLLRGKLGQKMYFRKHKSQFDELGVSARYPFLMGATCLPKDELAPFLKDVRKGKDDPLLGLFCDWLLGHHDQVLASLEY